ncbi:MAG: FAD-binding oxidoreductase [Bacteroidota bacterium]|nr:FAD-binding oxidoreductase [Rhodothermia bacterium]MCS7155462.1 FAD-binding oxidoreductase [Bacteroidota bacterium]MDW8138439.1 FAD-binding oxidoreductase [Bacteroidota bacterium]MDW8284624.1 FAD-binding oxidoreductase [Bacteroidota bacterium]
MNPLQTAAPSEIPPPDLVRDPDRIGAYLADASGFGPAWALGLVRPASEAEVAAFLRGTLQKPVPGSRRLPVPVLPQAGRSSLTGGAVPQGEVILSVERLSAIGRLERVSATEARLFVEPGVRLRQLQEHLAERGWYYPPVPTYQEACLGGTAATNAGGAATFKYGSTRDWIEGLRVILYNGDLLELWRGQAVARPGQRFEITLSCGSRLEVPVPTYQTPPLKKISAGYYGSDPLDLVDLFIGSEGTLGVITGLVVRVVSLPPSVLTGLLFLRSTAQAFRLSASLRDLALKTRSGEAGADVRAIELLDAACLKLLRPQSERWRLRVPSWAQAAVLVEAELSESLHTEELAERYGRWLAGTLGDRDPLGRLWDVIVAAGADVEAAEWALSDDPVRSAELVAFREAAPQTVNELLGRRRAQDPEVRKIGGDLIVPVAELEDCYRACQRAFARRGLEAAIWGHVSDGNLHPNGLPRTAAEVRLGYEALLELGDWVRARGGCPLSEHGVGRNPVKQALLARFWGPDALAQMWAVKRALDPFERLAPGVLLPPLEPA